MVNDRKTRIPAEVDSEDPFLSMAEIKLSLRQMLTIVLSATVWFMLLKTTTSVIPIPGLLAGLAWSWLLVGGLFLALVKKDGRPYEEYLARKIVFLISPRDWMMMDPKGSDSVLDADWEELDDELPPSIF